ncbi:MAG: hypothetical protein WCL07_00700 [bacterium]
MKLPNISKRRRQVNLLPRDPFEKSWWGIALSWALTFGKWSVIVTQLIVTIVFVTRFGYDRQLTDLNKNIATQVSIIKSHSEIERDYILTQKRVTYAGTILSQNNTMVSMLDKLQSQTPVDVWYERLTIGSKSTSIVADAGSLPGFSQLIRSFSTDKAYDSVSINNLQDGTKRGARFQFDITLAYTGSNGK